FRDKGSAVLWMGVTTAAAFGSLITSRVGPVRSFGVWASFGMAVLTVAALTFYPALLATIGRRTRPRSARKGTRDGPTAAAAVMPRGRLAHVGRTWAEAAVRRRIFVLGGAALIVLFGLVGAARLRPESNALTYLAADHPVRAAVESLERDGIGVSSVEVLVRHGVRPVHGAGAAPAGQARFDEPDALQKWGELARRVREHEDVIGAVGPADLVTGLASPLLSGDSPGEGAWRLAVAAIRNDPIGRAALAKLVTEDGQAGRLTVYVPTAGLERLGPLMDRVQREAAASFTEEDVAITGRLPLLLATQRYLLRTLVVSFSLTLVIIALVFRLLLGSLRVTALTMIPNLWPVIGVVGIMGWLSIPLDIGTVMVASIVLGLAVDDTIHTLEHFRELAPRVGRREAVASTLEITAPAYLLTGAVLIGGFGVLAASPFLPTARFGLLCAIGIALAVASNLFLLPALLGSVGPHLIDRFRQDQSNSRGAGRSAPSSSSR
ncbi:MAG: MMPL family transporter, partial [Acidobacteriota bacterium]|nr:MMPL family transporter [Acidobacteriota bacterium]